MREQLVDRRVDRGRGAAAEMVEILEELGVTRAAARRRVRSRAHADRASRHLDRHIPWRIPCRGSLSSGANLLPLLDR